MKKTLVASILGIAGSLAMVATSHAQGQLFFQNYASSPAFDAPVTFASNGIVNNNSVTGPNTAVTAGEGVGDEFTADLLYSLDGSTYTLLTQGNSGISFTGVGGFPATFTFGSTADGAVVPGSYGAGYFLGGSPTIQAYNGNPIWIMVEAYNGASYASSFGPGLWRGQSTPFQLASLGTGGNSPVYMTTMPAFTVSSVPEPTTMAFAGMGMLSLFGFIRRKKA